MISRTLSFLRRYFWLVAAIVAVALLVLSFEAGRWSLYRAHPEISQNEQAADILAKVGKLINLPQNEQPTMATISDAKAAKQGQPFLKDAQDGDVLIVYPNAAEALLYRPSTDKLVAVGPVTGEPAQPVRENPSAPEPATTTTTHATSTKAPTRN